MTPLMAATKRWNVRIVDYLMERGADPRIQDKHGFTVRQMAELRNLRTLTSMLTEYESKYKAVSKRPQAITNEKWR